MNTTIYSFSANDINQNEVKLDKFTGKVVLIVNTASACGFTPQYEGLETLYQQYKEQGLEIVAFPCNQFGKQEKGDAEEIEAFCNLHFNISFPLMDKIEVNGSNEAPLYTFLKSNGRGILGSKAVKWNFTKFLINKNGEVVKRFSPTTAPEKLTSAIETQLSL